MGAVCKWHSSCDELVQCVPTKKGHHILYKGYTYVFKSRLQCGAEQWCCSYRQKTGCISVINMQTYGVEVVSYLEKRRKKQVPDWLPIYFVKNNEKEYRCNICEILVATDEKSVELLDHIKNLHKEVYELHKDNPESTVGFQIEFLQFSMLKDDKTQPVILEEVCEEATDEIVKIETDKDDAGTQYILVPRKKKLKRTYEFSRKRSWVWKYFERMTNIIYRCNLCNVVLSIKGCNTNNMNRHVRTRHPSVYKSEVDKKKDFTDIDQLDTSWKKDDENDKDLDESLDILKQRRSWIWSYFRRVSNTLAQCKICNRNICHGGNATGNMNRHLKMIHNKTADDNNWVWKVFENAEDDFYTCKICQFKCMKFADVEKSIKCFLHHLKNEHGVISGDQIITGTEYEMENPE
ncbi:unnamed protein product [Euphydryas editha]|uniref:BED-type domain-containing protein n=1 Tax=Euphydryas editha TaxID=104508 RepID=A0AAU9TG76_EUPED|nr:unnamed protein product [Euphydryas editha]